MKKLIYILLLVSAYANSQSRGSEGEYDYENKKEIINTTIDSSIDNNTANNTLTIDNRDIRRLPVHTAFAYAVAPSAPCMGSSGFGGTTSIISLSFATTWISKDCNFREDVRTAFNYGDPRVALEMLRWGMPAYSEAEKRINNKNK